MNETQSIEGRLYLRLLNPAGEVVEERQVQNRITSQGREIVASLFAGLPISHVAYFGVGTGEGPTGNDTVELVNEVRIQPGQYRKALNAPQVAKDETGRWKVTFIGELGPNEPAQGLPVALSEAGLFNDAGMLSDAGTVTPRPRPGGGLVVFRPGSGGTSVVLPFGSSPVSGSTVSNAGTQTRQRDLSASLTENQVPNPPAGGMYNRVTFEKVTKSAGFSLQLKWEIIF